MKLSQLQFDLPKNLILEALSDTRTILNPIAALLPFNNKTPYAYEMSNNSFKTKIYKIHTRIEYDSNYF